jgi:hypothetical protein
MYERVIREATQADDLHSYLNELSRAARAFKAQALTAASSPAHHGATEVFRRGELRSPVLAAVG